MSAPLPSLFAAQVLSATEDFLGRPGPSKFVRPDCTEKCPNAGMHGGPCGSCKMGTNPGRTHRFFTGDAVIPFVK